MPDKMTPDGRHRCMSHVRSKDTKPEMTVRRFLFARGFRYRIHVKSLPGKPDIVMRKYRTVIFVNGCFWHGHEGCGSYSMPKSNVEFWRSKIERNRERDLREAVRLRSLGWHVVKIWECQLKPKVCASTLTSLEYTLNRIFLLNRGAKEQAETKPYEARAFPEDKPYDEPESLATVAAEPQAAYGKSEPDENAKLNA